MNHPQPKEPIAIIGIGCRFPGDADSPEKFWRLLENGVDAITPIPASRWDTTRYEGVIPNHGGFIQQVDKFDAEFFHVAPKEAIALDPQQRLLLEVSWEALEHAGINPADLRDSDTGVFVGIFTNDYQMLEVKQQDDPHLYMSTGASAATASGRIAYFFGWHGPAVSVDTASSSSLVALHYAVMSVQSGECQMALAAGVNLILAPDLSIAFTRAGMLSPDGRSKGFDAAANGYVRGEGCGVVVLKRLSDALRDGDNVLALVRGTAINQDGASQGLTTPSGESQAAVIRKALATAGLEPGDVYYIEAHGSGTPVGDPIEGNALQQVYGAGRTQPWVVGSVKTNIGHLEAAAGIAGVIKAVLALQHQMIPQHLHFQRLNPALTGLQAIIPTQRMAWKNGSGARRAAVSSFGFSGTNAHAILEQAPQDLPFTRYALQMLQQPSRQVAGIANAERPVGKARTHHLCLLSAQDSQALHELAQRYIAHLSVHPEMTFLADLCYTTQVGRAQFAHRLAAVATTTAELSEQLQAFVAGETATGLCVGQPAIAKPALSNAEGHPVGTERPGIAFLFTGQGSQYVGMGRELYETQPAFRAALDRCDELLQKHLGESLLDVIYPDRETGKQGDKETRSNDAQSAIRNLQSAIDDTTYTQPALFAIEYALATLWQSWGIQPDLLIGHSVGELAAACVAGVFSLEDGLKLVAARGRLMGALPQDGEMIALLTNEARAQAAIASYSDLVSLATINGPQNIVISGKREAVLAIAEQLAAEGIKTHKLAVSHAFHSPLMEPMLDEFRAVASSITYHKPRLRIVSNVTGKLADDAPALSGVEGMLSPEYWVRHVRQAVRFADGVTTLHDQGIGIFLEIGPKPVLVGMAEQCLDTETGSKVDRETRRHGDTENNSPLLPRSPAPMLFLPSLREGQNDWQPMLTSLAALYAHGSAVDWSGFTQDESNQRQRLALPTYPFQRQRYWIATPARQVSFAATDGGFNQRTPGRQRLALANDPSLRFSFEVGQELPPYLKHHRIFGKPILAAGFYLESALGTGKDCFNSEHLCLQNVTLEQALVLPEIPTETLTMQIVLTPGESEENTVQIFSLSASQSLRDASQSANPIWVRHATGQLRVVNNVRSNASETTADDQTVDLATLRQQCPESVAVDSFYSQMAARQIVYRMPQVGAGLVPAPETATYTLNQVETLREVEGYQVLQELWRGEGCALGRAQLDPKLASEAELYGLHSLLIESSIQVALATLSATQPAQTYLPVSLEQLTLYRGGAMMLWAYATLRSSATETDLVSADLLLFDEAGIVARLTGLVLKRTTPQVLFRPAQRGEQCHPEERRTSTAKPAQVGATLRGCLEQLAQTPRAQQPAVMSAFVQKQVRQVLGLRSGQSLSVDRPLRELGLDSLMTSDLKNRLEREFKLIIPAEQIMRSGVSAQSLSEQLLGRLQEKIGASSAPSVPVVIEPEEEDFSAAAAEVPQIYAVVTEQIGRKVKVEGRWIFDFASCNYLGIDLQPEVMEAIPPALKKWGVHPSWTRAVASPGIYEDLEHALADLLGAPMTLVFPAITLLHAGVLPVLAGDAGIIIKDISAHHSIIEACRLAQTHGAEYIDFKHNDPVDLEAKLARYPRERTKIIAIDGVYSMSGEYPPLPAFARLAKEYNCWVYIDDAHGIGVIGENPSPEAPYGHKGNGIVRYYGLDYVQDRLIYVAGLSKSFSSFGAFISCNDMKMKNLFRSASTFIFSGPSPTASLASAIAGIQLNQRDGEMWRAEIYRLTHRMITGSKALGFEVINDNYFPIVCVVIGKTRDVVEACKILWEYGILITPALYPIVPKDKGLLRFSITAANTEEEIDRAVESLAAVRERLRL